jgi:VDE lipocalin domain
MVQKCGPQIFACVNDPDCKAALDCLQACDPTDQVPNARLSHDARCFRISKRLAYMLLFVPASVLLPVVQVCSYQCIVTYESQLLEDFSLCILEVQDHNTLCEVIECFAPRTKFAGACQWLQAWLLPVVQATLKVC